MRPFLITLLSFLLLSCSESSPTAPDGPVAFTEVYTDMYSGILTRRQEIIATPTQWQRVWDEIYARRSPKPALPAVNFENSLLIVVGLGDTGDACKRVAVESVTRSGGALNVSVKEIRPPASCVCPPVTVQPVQVVSIPRLATGAGFQWRSVTEGSGCN